MKNSMIILIVVVVIILVAILMTTPTCKQVVSGIFKGRKQAVATGHPPEPRRIAEAKGPQLKEPFKPKPKPVDPQNPIPVPQNNLDNPVFPPNQRGVVQPQAGTPVLPPSSLVDPRNNADIASFPPHQRGVVQPQAGTPNLPGQEIMDPSHNEDRQQFPPHQRGVVQPQSAHGFPVLSGNLYSLLDSKVDVKSNFGISEEELNAMAKKYKETHLDVPKPEIIRNRHLNRTAAENAEAVLLQSFINSAGSGQRPDTEQLVVEVMRDRVASQQKGSKGKVAVGRKSSRR